MRRSLARLSGLARYSYQPSALASLEPMTSADVLIIAGGVYGNQHALTSLERMVEAEVRNGRTARLIFNGDFNFLNCDPASFVEMNRRIKDHHKAILGNVEIEAVDPTPDAGCGCQYPSYVASSTEENAEMIVNRLKSTVGELCNSDNSHHQSGQELACWLRELPMFGVAEGAGLRVGIIHGDLTNLAGWSFAAEAVAPPDHTLRKQLGAEHAECQSPREVIAQLAAAQIDLLACTHTCLPFGRVYDNDDNNDDDDGDGLGAGGGDRARAVFNNGAAGMGNFDIDSSRLICGNSSLATCGIATRVAPLDCPPPMDDGGALYGCKLGSARVDAVPVHFDLQAWREDFERLWRPGSPAWNSYHARIVGGFPGYTVEQAARRVGL